MLVGLALQDNKHESKARDKSAKELSSFLEAIAQERCKASFCQIFEHFAPRLRSYALKQIGNEALAMELVQDTMANVWQKAHLFDYGKGSPSTWIFTIARNLRFDMLRKMQNRKEDVCSDDLWPILVEQNAYTDEESVDDTVTLEQIMAYVEKLPAKQSYVIRSIYIQGKSQQEVADDAGIPLGTVKSRTRLALQKLKELMEEYD